MVFLMTIELTSTLWVISHSFCIYRALGSLLKCSSSFSILVDTSHDYHMTYSLNTFYSFKLSKHVLWDLQDSATQTKGLISLLMCRLHLSADVLEVAGSKLTSTILDLTTLLRSALQSKKGHYQANYYIYKRL